MKKFLAITPYFGGVSSAPRQTELNNVLRYFEHTYNSLKPLMTKLIVGVYNDADYNTLRPFQLNSDIEVIIWPNNLDSSRFLWEKGKFISTSEMGDLIAENI